MSFNNIKKIDLSAPGSFNEIRTLQRIIKTGDLDAIAEALERYGVDVSTVAFADLAQIVQAIAGGDSPLSTPTDGTM